MSGAVSTPALPGARPLRRLGLALAVSVALHVWFVWGVRVVAPRHAPEPGTIRATLAPAPAGAVTPEPRPTSVAIQASTTADLPANRDAPAASAPAPTTATPTPTIPQPPAPARIPAPPEPAAALAAAPEINTFGPALEVPQIEDPEFYPARQLDVLPRPLGDVALRYPEGAADQDLSGRVVLMILIDELGMVVEATVISADPPGVFEEAALESFRDVMFAPAQRHGRAVKSRLPVEVNFDAKVGSLKQ